jgi:signal transduction histidine kinase
MAKELLDYQLREVGQMSGAHWAAMLERMDSGWDLRAAYKLPHDRRTTLMGALKHQEIMDWIDSALAAQQYKAWSVAGTSDLGCEKLGIFPDPEKKRPILVGADEFSAEEQRLWHVFALCQVEPASGSSAAIPIPTIAFSELGGIPFNLNQAMERLLSTVLRTVPCRGGWLAIRSGDALEVIAQNQSAESINRRFSFDGNSILQKINFTRTMLVIQSDQPEWAVVPQVESLSQTGIWAGLPLVIGRRLIGLIALWRKEPFLLNELEALRKLMTQAATLLDESITFSDLTNHLRRLALLNDFAITVSSALDLEQIAQRVFALLRRAFGTELINLILLSSDGDLLYHYYDLGGSIVVHTLRTEEFPALKPVYLGEVFRSEDIQSVANYVTVYRDVQSALAVPLKFRRQIIGSLGLESVNPGAFTIYDEHLLMVIASHLAGLIENGRLRQEAEARARNLSLIHEVVQQVIGATDVHQVAQSAAESIARNFAYELAVVALLKGPGRETIIEGIGGKSAEIVQQGLYHMDTPGRDGIISRVAATGQSMVANDVAQDPFYRAIPNWEAGSEMCVPLREGDRILGVIDVESQQKNAFAQSDRLVLESLAGILASVISKVGQYQELQITVRQLEAAREELQQRITAQRIAEARLIQAAKLAAVGEMAAGIAHELNNPLTSITGFTELVMNELPKDSTNRQDLELVLREARRARDVVLRLLDFARQGESVRVKADVNEIVTDVLALVSHLMHTSGVTVRTRLASNLHWALLDRNQLKQVILNLVHNALHAMPDGGKLNIKTEMRPREGRDWITISIQDTGQGIPRENLPRIFEPFFTTKSKSGGTGLGLSVSYGIITDHGGYIEVESEVRKGSEFTVWLPIEAE